MEELRADNTRRLRNRHFSDVEHLMQTSGWIFIWSFSFALLPSAPVPGFCTSALVAGFFSSAVGRSTFGSGFLPSAFPSGCFSLALASGLLSGLLSGFFTSALDDPACAFFWLAAAILSSNNLAFSFFVNPAIMSGVFVSVGRSGFFDTSSFLPGAVEPGFCLWLLGPGVLGPGLPSAWLPYPWLGRAGCASRRLG